LNEISTHVSHLDLSFTNRRVSECRHENTKQRKKEKNRNGGVKKHHCFFVPFCVMSQESSFFREMLASLSSEAVESAALALQGVHDVQSSHGLAASVLSVGHSVADDVLKEHLQDTSSLLVDESGDALHAASACESSNGGLGDALDVVAKDLSVALGSALSRVPFLLFLFLTFFDFVVCLNC
jgi:hypothetical protein